MNRMSIESVNALDAGAFTDRFGDVAEGSPWVAEAAFEARPFAGREASIAAFAAAVAAAVSWRARRDNETCRSPR